MPTVSKQTVDGVDYDIMDKNGRTELRRNISDALTEITGTDVRVIPITNVNQYINLSGASVTMENGVPQISGPSTNFSCSVIPCAEGDIFTINGKGTTLARLFGFVSSTGEILHVCPENSEYNNLIQIAPEGTAFLIYHTFNATAVTSYYGNGTRQLPDMLLDNNVNVLKKFATYSTKTINGIQYKWDYNKKKCTMTGTSNAISSYFLWSYDDGMPDGIEAGEEYQLVVNRSAKATNTGVRIYIKHTDTTVTNETYYMSQFIKIPDDAIGVSVVVRNPASQTLSGATIEVGIYPMNGYRKNMIRNQIEELMDIQKNLIPVFTNKTSPKTDKGITYTWNNDYTAMILNGTANGVSPLYFICSYDDPLPEEIVPGKTYKINFEASIDQLICYKYIVKHSDNSIDRYEYTDSQYIDIPQDATGVTIAIKVVNGTVCSNETAKISMSLAEKQTERKSGGENSLASMIGWGSSFVFGAIYPDGTLDHYCSFENSPWGNIAIEIGIPEANTKLIRMPSTGLLYDAGQGSVLDAIEATDLSGYDYVLAEINRPDLGISADGFPLGNLSSVAGDGSIVGAVLELLAYMKNSNPNATLIMLGPPPSSYDPNYSYNNVFTAVYRNGSSIADVDIMMHRLAVREHFLYVDWEDLNLSYYYPDLTYNHSNVHPMEDITCRVMGEYAARCLSYSASQIKVLKADAQG